MLDPIFNNGALKVKIGCFFNGIWNLGYHSIMHNNKDPKSFKVAVEIVLHYKHASKDHNKPKSAK